MNVHQAYAAISPWFRRRRLELFRASLQPRAGERLLDVGGYPWNWETGFAGLSITLVNPDFPDNANSGSASRFACIRADGRALPFADGSFDIVFSNSVIEHVGGSEDQRAFARELLRVGRRIWIQTPARAFPIEPHLLAPCIHWFPASWRRRLVRNFTPRGWIERPNPAQVRELSEGIRLLSRLEMGELFPSCSVWVERFLGLPKSYVAVRR